MVPMNSSENARDTALASTDAAVCPLSSPLVAGIPGLLSIAAVPVAILMSPFFFGIAGGLLAIISLLLSPPRRRYLGIVGLVGAVVGGSLGAFVSF